ncbi:hypothetical protein CRT38_02362 [Anaplasma phagocytophilum str. CRT38]|uniref:Uncharacterized protein n=1 Tax=Anaplasma phagocytophilum str. CRT38 TaxID=1269275 RepID=S6GAV7_ANAPH|nr:hypothetical protein CRT38_02362 [Anaplasma phagocytophilum str. CRT38]KDB57224.1 hypothetical protein P030_03755 [Anaplasma phagocytophilum str. CRT35]
MYWYANDDIQKIVWKSILIYDIPFVFHLYKFFTKHYEIGSSYKRGYAAIASCEGPRRYSGRKLFVTFKVMGQ